MLRKIYLLAAGLMIWSNSVFAHGDEGGCMMNFRYGGIYMWIILIIIIGVVIYFVLKKSRPDERGGSSPERPLEILKKRYAAGEITRDEYERMRNDLEK